MSHENHTKTTNIAVGLLEFLADIRQEVELPPTATLGDIFSRIEDLMETERDYDTRRDNCHCCCQPYCECVS